VIKVAALYVDTESGPYPSMPGVDCWGVERDAKTYEGPHPVVAHPPCGPWGKLAWACKYQDASCGPRAVEQVLKWGGVLEHPAQSLLWKECGLPLPGECRGLFGRNDVWTLEADQVRWGHRAQKRSWFLMVGIPRSAVFPLPPMRPPTHSIQGGKKGSRDQLPGLSKPQRRCTPPEFAAWLVGLARQSRRPSC
jgi:hypothetical protein